MRVLKIKPRSSVRPAIALNRWVIFPVKDLFKTCLPSARKSIGDFYLWNYRLNITTIAAQSLQNWWTVKTVEQSVSLLFRLADRPPADTMMRHALSRMVWNFEQEDQGFYCLNGLSREFWKYCDHFNHAFSFHLERISHMLFNPCSCPISRH